MEKSFDRLLAECPAARGVIRAWTALNALIGSCPELAPAQTEIKLAALHIEDALRELIAALPNE